MPESSQHEFVHWFRDSSPYINAFRGRTFVLTVGGEVVADAMFATLVHDIALLHSLGVKLVLVHGARPQIESRLKQEGLELDYVNGLRITTEAALVCVKQAAGSVRMDIEALLSMGLANSPMAGAKIRVASGNFVTAKPYGVIEGVDYRHTGQVRRIDAEAINKQLDDGNIVLLSPLGYSPTGESFNFSAEDVAASAAIQLKAEKLIYLTDIQELHEASEQALRELTLREIAAMPALSEPMDRTLQNAANACRQGVPRVHLLDAWLDGALLVELFTRDGCGTLITAESFEGTRQATIDDVGGILELIAPLEQQGILVRRSREKLEMEIDYFTVIERDNTVIGCAALYPDSEAAVGELACLAIHPDYARQGKGDTLLEYLTRHARKLGLERIFVLTTHTAHWFQERGFEAADIGQLPMHRQEMYNYQRNSKVFIRKLVDG
ncbi:MAG: amino-acid N-acetyltransferase [Gammaproteobacteria bacterium]|nr:amino-acid N-acetyltransferase [Gammaproteobacteria bacterium]